MSSCWCCATSSRSCVGRSCGRNFGWLIERCSQPRRVTCRARREARGVHKLDLPCKEADSAATADVTAYGTDDAEKPKGRSSPTAERAPVVDRCRCAVG